MTQDDRSRKKNNKQMCCMSQNQAYKNNILLSF